MPHNQINLSDMPVDANRNFLRALYTANDLQDARRWFDKLDSSVSSSRQRDPDMSLDEFLGLMTNRFNIVLQIGSPIEEEIRYSASSLGERVERFAWTECPFTDHNYNIVSGLFNESYGRNIDSIPVPELISSHKMDKTPQQFRESLTSLLDSGTLSSVSTNINNSLDAKYQLFLQQSGRSEARRILERLGYDTALGYACIFRDFGREDLALNINSDVSKVNPDITSPFVPDTIYGVEFRAGDEKQIRYFCNLPHAQATHALKEDIGEPNVKLVHIAKTT